MDKTYTGIRTLDGLISITRVMVSDGNTTRPLSKRFADHSPQFEWGYSGWGPTQLGLCLLGDYLHPKKLDDYPSDLCEKLMMNIVSKLPPFRWILTAEQLHYCIFNERSGND